MTGHVTPDYLTGHVSPDMLVGFAEPVQLTLNASAVTLAPTPPSMLVGDRFSFRAVDATMGVDALREVKLLAANVETITIVGEPTLDAMYREAVQTIQELPNAAFRKSKDRASLAKKFAEVANLVTSFQLCDAVDKLSRDIWAVLDGQPAPPDWVNSSDLREQVEGLITRLRGLAQGCE